MSNRGECCCRFGNNRHCRIKNKLRQIITGSVRENKRNQPIPHTENGKRKLTEQQIGLELTPTGSCFFNNNTDKGIIYCVPYCCKTVMKSKIIEIDFNNVIYVALFEVIDIKTCSSIVKTYATVSFLLTKRRFSKSFD